MSQGNLDTNVVTATPPRPRSMEDDESGHSVDLKVTDTVRVKSETESEDDDEYYEDKPTKGEKVKRH
ncbi:hypothetical protein L1987_41427 [Smallanthus sonchifolius]|uniref:Uncharacterized protein n=1 Tax=Smallanthus sonchifolius TaxID=185202 RepID=A0ACB9GVV9_9ASTR|nr:hypothetical protein L1987_41427 [Smallanthus sonchifolius]